MGNYSRKGKGGKEIGREVGREVGREGIRGESKLILLPIRLVILPYLTA